MTTWEYREEWRADGEEPVDLQAMGADGWEMCAALRTAAGVKWTFKRPVKDVVFVVRG